MRIDKDNIKIILILLILGLGIGYSYLNTDLAINGTANINSANWDVYWNNVQVKSGSVEASTPIISNQTTVSFNVTLEEPGDYYEFTVDAVNAGTLDAMIDTVSSKLNGTTITTLPTYLEYNVTYADDTPLEGNQELLHDTTETYKVRIEYKDDISASELPGTNQSLSLEFSVAYKQADDTSQVVDHGTIVYTLSGLQVGEEISEGITLYNSGTDALAVLPNNSLYLKHLIRKGIVEQSYVEFVITPEIANNNQGATAGTYSLRGPDSCEYDLLTEGYVCKNDYYIDNKRILQIAFGSDNCEETVTPDFTRFSCSIVGIYSNIIISNGVAVGNGRWYGYIGYYGNSMFNEDY